jgi:S1-C subfamily serine protease
MGFALPSSGVLKNVTSIIEFGHADNIDSGISKSRPLIGITGVGVAKDTWYKNVVSAAGTSIEKVDEAYAKLHPDTTFYAAITGVYVSATNPDLNAAQYIQINDIITEINGIPVTNIYEVMDIINQYDGGDSVSVKYYRNGVYNTVDVILGNE